ncbi:MAG: hypothetical protein K0B14_18460, partial [Anaerolineaceae bacterium]|nr:hypothetical protein [Anaerolineaceae bacterium]
LRHVFLYGDGTDARHLFGHPISRQHPQRRSDNRLGLQFYAARPPADLPTGESGSGKGVLKCKIGKFPFHFNFPILQLTHFPGKTNNPPFPFR